LRRRAHGRTGSEAGQHLGLSHRTSLVDPDTLASILKTGKHFSSMASVINEAAALMEVIWAGAEQENFRYGTRQPKSHQIWPDGQSIFARRHS
jgi:hypothetical protein